jgi:hypothetical protein
MKGRPPQAPPKQKRERRRASPSPSEGGGVPGRARLGTVVCGRKAIKFLIEKGRRRSLYSAKTLP